MTALLNWRVWAALGLAVVLAISHGMAYRTGRALVRADWDAEKVVQLNAQKESDRENRNTESKRQTGVINAQNARVKRDMVLQTDAASSRAVVDGLRDDIRAATADLPSRAAGAVSQYAAASGQLLAECSATYSGVARQADGHASDALMLEQAWPK